MVRAQFVVEFTIITAVVVLISLAYLAITNSLLTDTADRQRFIALNDVGYMVQDELLLAAVVEEGYERSFYLPERADRFEYTVRNSNTTLTLKSSMVTVSYEIPRIAGSIQKGRNTVYKSGNLTVVPG